MSKTFHLQTLIINSAGFHDKILKFIKIYNRYIKKNNTKNSLHKQSQGVHSTKLSPE